jgi:hypothetical protein
VSLSTDADFGEIGLQLPTHISKGNIMIRLRLVLSVLILATVLVTSPVPSSAAQNCVDVPVYRFRAETRVRTVTRIVIDERGRPIAVQQQVQYTVFVPVIEYVRVCR